MIAEHTVFIDTRIKRVKLRIHTACALIESRFSQLARQLSIHPKLYKSEAKHFVALFGDGYTPTIQEYLIFYIAAIKAHRIESSFPVGGEDVTDPHKLTFSVSFYHKGKREPFCVWKFTMGKNEQIHRDQIKCNGSMLNCF